MRDYGRHRVIDSERFLYVDRDQGSVRLRASVYFFVSPVSGAADANERLDDQQYGDG